MDDDVCEGAIGLEGPIIAHGMRHMDVGSKTAKLFCINFLGLCEYPKVNAWNVPFASEKPSQSRPIPSSQTPIKIVHFSDTHVDPFYKEGANANCTKPICCRPYTKADEPDNNNAPAGPNGDHNCDTPIVLQQSMFNAIQTLVPDATFGMFNGDIVDHAIWATSIGQNTANINDVYNLAKGILPILYGTAGNHEQHPTNAFPTTSQNRDDNEWVYSLLSDLWGPWIGEAAATTTVMQFGAYSAKFPGGGLRIISLNTNMYYIQNYWLYQKNMERDPSGQLKWLASELQAAEDAGDRAYIIGHMPMGGHDAFHDGSNYFDQIVNRYENTIAAMFFGHTHKDEFQVSYRDYGNRTAETAMAVAYIMPSLTPTDGHPAFRVYKVDPATFAILDAETYIADMSAEGFQTSGPKWNKYYSAREVYGPLVSHPPGETDELGPRFWHEVTEVLERDPTALQAYLDRKSRGYEHETCTSVKCIASTVCLLRGGRAQDNCYKPEPGHVSFRRSKRDVNGEPSLRRDVTHRHKDACGFSATIETLSTLVGRKDLVEQFIMGAVQAGAPVQRN